METRRATLPQQGDEGSPQGHKVASLPGFRFQPTEEELVGFYLRSMVMGNLRLEVEPINVLDLYRYEPWELPAMAFIQSEREWLFFCPRDKKYPNGARPNRVTASGYWKATGTDRQVRRAHDACCIGLKKTLVFYTGKAPRGHKTQWIMNEYRLPQDQQYLRNSQDPREVVLCRIYMKPAPYPLTASQGFHVAMEEGLGSDSSPYTVEYGDPGGDDRDSTFHIASPCASASTLSPTSPKLPGFRDQPMRDSICATDPSMTRRYEHNSRSTTAARWPQYHDASHMMQSTTVKVETGSLSSVVYPCPEKLQSVDALPQQLEVEARRGRSFLIESPESRGTSPEVGTPGIHQLHLVDRVLDHAGFSSNQNPTSLDRLLKSTMWPSPLANADGLLPVVSSSSSSSLPFFSTQQFGWNYGADVRESQWSHSSSSSLPTRQSLLQNQGLQNQFQ